MSHRLSRFALLVVFVASSSTFAGEHAVGSAAEIETALADAKPGDVLILNDGEWVDQVIKVAAKGTKDQPITLRAKTPGKVKLLGNCSIVLAGDHCFVSGVFFGESTIGEPVVAFVGNDNRLTDSAIVSQNRGGKWIHFQKGQRNRLDHCY
ncbi:MAG: alginate lyase, partial [Planctomycetota bacterium]|nr:alginate lyase [Planctomycetota bacterium]